MNAAVRVAVRVGLDQGHTLLAVRNGFRGPLDGSVEELEWMSVSGWAARPGAELGTTDFVPGPDQLAHLASQLAAHRVDGLLLIGGWAAFETAHL